MFSVSLRTRNIICRHTNRYINNTLLPYNVKAMGFRMHIVIKALGDFYSNNLLLILAYYSTSRSIRELYHTLAVIRMRRITEKGIFNIIVPCRRKGDVQSTTREREKIVDKDYYSIIIILENPPLMIT